VQEKLNLADLQELKDWFEELCRNQPELELDGFDEPTMRRLAIHIVRAISSKKRAP
jgi:hypothetical protein